MFTNFSTRVAVERRDIDRRAHPGREICRGRGFREDVECVRKGQRPMTVEGAGGYATFDQAIRPVNQEAELL